MIEQPHDWDTLLGLPIHSFIRFVNPIHPVGRLLLSRTGTHSFGRRHPIVNAFFPATLNSVCEAFVAFSVANFTGKEIQPIELFKVSKQAPKMKSVKIKKRWIEYIVVSHFALHQLFDYRQKLHCLYALQGLRDFPAISSISTEDGSLVGKSSTVPMCR